MLAVGIALLFVAAPPAGAKTRVRISFAADAISATVTPGVKSAWFSVAHDSAISGLRYTHRGEIIEDVDGDGVVRLALEAPPGPNAIWVVVDLETGDYDVAAPPEGVLRRLPIRPGAWRAKGNSRAARLLQPNIFGTTFVVRPRVGAWIAIVEDSAPNDEDPELGTIGTDLDRLKSVGASPAPPDELEHGDVIFLASPSALTIYDGVVR